MTLRQCAPYPRPPTVVPGGVVVGLPIGIQVMGGHFTDLRCPFTIAAEIEATVGLFADRRSRSDGVTVLCLDSRAGRRFVDALRGVWDLMARRLPVGQRLPPRALSGVVPRRCGRAASSVDHEC